ncbi:MAG: hypothetical protein RL095_42 [Verrucomicrobiota bacterium]|jgi:hypothetical protein
MLKSSMLSLSLLALASCQSQRHEEFFLSYADVEIIASTDPKTEHAAYYDPKGKSAYFEGQHSPTLTKICERFHAPATHGPLTVHHAGKSIVYRWRDAKPEYCSASVEGREFLWIGMGLMIRGISGKPTDQDIELYQLVSGLPKSHPQHFIKLQGEITIP